MVSMWGSKKDDQDDDPPRSFEDDRSSSRRELHNGTRDPDERTRLLPRNHSPQRSDGYLDPDDPAVSTLDELEEVSCTKTS